MLCCSCNTVLSSNYHILLSFIVLHYLINRIAFHHHSNEQKNESSYQINDNFPHGRGKHCRNGFHQCMRAHSAKSWILNRNSQTCKIKIDWNYEIIIWNFPTRHRRCYLLYFKVLIQNLSTFACSYDIWSKWMRCDMISAIERMIVRVHVLMTNMRISESVFDQPATLLADQFDLFIFFTGVYNVCRKCKAIRVYVIVLCNKAQSWFIWKDLTDIWTTHTNTYNEKQRWRGNNEKRWFTIYTKKKLLLFHRWQ